MILVCYCFAAEDNFLGNRHINDYGLSCDSCHEENPPSIPVKAIKCLECHESYAVLAAQTEEVFPNPHDNHMVVDGVECSECHHSHRVPALLCDSCHQFDLNVK